MAIDVDDPRRRAAAGQCQPQEHLRRDQVALGRQHELDGLAGRIDSAIQVGPVASNLQVGLIDPPRPIRTAQLAANPLIQNRCIPLDPAPDRDMIHGEVPLRHDLLQVTIRQRESQVPANAQEDDHVVEVPPTKQCWPFSGHDKPYQISSGRTCNRTMSQLTAADRRADLPGRQHRGRHSVAAAEGSGDSSGQSRRR